MFSDEAFPESQPLGVLEKVSDAVMIESNYGKGYVAIHMSCCSSSMKATTFHSSRMHLGFPHRFLSQ